jgi:hypothetical protein
MVINTRGIAIAQNRPWPGILDSFSGDFRSEKFMAKKL